MKSLKYIGALLIMGLSVFPGTMGSAAAFSKDPPRQGVVDTGPLLPTQIVVRTKLRRELGALGWPDPHALEAGISHAARTPAAFVREQHGLAVYRFNRHLDPAELDATLRQIAAMADVASVEMDLVVHPTDRPNDTYYGFQWDLLSDNAGINVEPAWGETHGGSSVPIAILDTGITAHPDLAGQVVGGYDFISYPPMARDGDGRDPNPEDPGDWALAGECGAGTAAHPASWHGTHVAGTVSALANNQIGVVGIAYGAPLEIIRVLGRCGGFLTDIADGLRWAAGLHVEGVPDNPRPAWVLSLSLGGFGGCPDYFQAAIDDVRAMGGIVVAAAGNSNQDVSTFTPANCKGVIAVGATDRNGDKAYFTNYGTGISLSAPGDNILSTWNSGTFALGSPAYTYMSGTSMAAPHVAAVAALVLSVQPGLSTDQVKGILTGSARSFSACSSCTSRLCGAGIVDAGQAVQAALHTHVDVPQVRPTPDPVASSLVTNGTVLSSPGAAEGILAPQGDNFLTSGGSSAGDCGAQAPPGQEKNYLPIVKTGP